MRWNTRCRFILKTRKETLVAVCARKMKCYKDEGEMMPVVVDYEYHGIVVKGVKALRCPVCGEEVIDVDEYGRVKRRIESMIKPLRLRRKISSAGNRPAVYLPDDVVNAVKVEIGDDVEIYFEGNRIIIEPVSPD